MAKSTAYTGGIVYTMEREGETVSAFVVENGRFVYCGDDETAKSLADEQVDLKGAVVMPGMIDTHQHLYAYSRNLTKVNLEKARSVRDIKEMLAARAKETKKGEWILGMGFDHEKFDEHRLPTRYELDEACPDNPVVITRYCLHVNVANSEALNKGGIGKGFKPHVEGTVKFDEAGEPTGELNDEAATDILALVPDPLASREARKNILEKACHELNSHGLTGVHPVRAAHVDLPEYIDLYQDLKDEGRLTLRVYVGLDQLPETDIRTGLGDDMVKYGYYKLFADGNIGGRTAWLFEPFSDDPVDPENTGVPNYTLEELTPLVRAAYERNIQVGMHVIGDRAADMFVSALETVYRENPKPDPRFRVIHASLVNDDIIARIAKLPAVVDIQPNFLSNNLKWQDARFGKARETYQYCWRKFLDAGIMLNAGSDSPVGFYDPFWSAYAIVNRKNLEGEPEGGWHPENCVTPYEALRMYTWNAAYASFEENIKGSIKEGKLADFIIIDADPFNIDPMKIKDIHVEKTYLGGACVYTR
ncbi:MAG: amidohydrolase [Lachnospiraceae bacterium]|nr:amidohydrolase [Lachnospiraceae bacterium]